MIRISINWYFVSPSLQTAKGTFLVEEVDASCTRVPAIKNIPIIKGKVSVTPSSLGYEDINGEGISTKIFDMFHSKLDTMIRSYICGVMINDEMFDWIEDITYGEIKNLEGEK